MANQKQEKLLNVKELPAVIGCVEQENFEDYF